MPENSGELPLSFRIKAAQALYDRMKDWQRKDEILNDLKESYRDFADFHGTLLKILAVNQFYFAGCPDIPDMADWLKRTGQSIVERYHSIKEKTYDEEAGRDEDYIQIVQDIAKMGQKKDKYDGWVVFAAKFAHFFIDPDAFPLLDSRAEIMVQFHLSHGNVFDKFEKIYEDGKRYREFYCNFKKLQVSIFDPQTRANPDNKQLDQYLWLAGTCRQLKLAAAKKVKGISVNKEIGQAYKRAFKEHDPDLVMQKLFTDLFPYKVPDEQAEGHVEESEASGR